jgi:hypothetical protein
MESWDPMHFYVGRGSIWRDWIPIWFSICVTKGSGLARYVSATIVRVFAVETIG